MEPWQFWTLVVIGSLILLALVPALTVIISAIFGFIFFIACIPLAVCGALYLILPENHEWYSTVYVWFWLALVIAVPSLVGWIVLALYSYACDRSVPERTQE